ncbi:MAG: hypothetical protein GY769_19550 [bacterium]|nr:hypothetical protein [bacterium]
MTLELRPEVEPERVAMTSPEPWKPNWHAPVRRREVLAWISALVLAPSIEGIARASGLGVLGDPSGATLAPDELPIGYLEGSDVWDLSSLEQSMPGARVVPARALAGGDVDLSLGCARVTVHGLYPQLPKRGVFDRVDLSVFFPSPELDQPDELLSYFAWSYGESPVLNLGASNRFDVPVGIDGSLPLLVETLPCRSGSILGATFPTSDPTSGWMPDTPEVLSRFANFTVDSDPLRPKLRSGAYLLAVSGNPWPEPVTLPHADEIPAPELLSLLLTVEEHVVAEGAEHDGESSDATEVVDPLAEPDPDPVGSCDGTNGDLVLVSQEVNSTTTESACRSIAASEYKVRDGGAVTFDSPSIALGDGFEVQGEFAAKNRPV